MPCTGDPMALPPVMKDDVARSVDTAVALVHHSRQLEHPKLREWHVLVEATGYGELLRELHRTMRPHVLGVIRHWASVEVLPTWLEEAAERGGREGYVAAWRSKLEEEAWFDAPGPDRAESARREAKRHLLAGSFEMLIRLTHALVESHAPAVIEEVHHAWVRETLQAARPVAQPGGRILDNIQPVGQNAMHAKREHEVHRRSNRVHAVLAVDPAEVLDERPYQGSIYALPCRARELETESMLRLLLSSRDAMHAAEARAEADLQAVKKELVDTLAELQHERNARLEREATDRRDMQNMRSEHNAVMLREAMRVQEEEKRAGENQMEFANKLSDMNAARVQYEEQLRVYQEASESYKEEKEALRAAQRKILDLRQEILTVKAEAAAAVAAAEAQGNTALQERIAHLEHTRVTLVMNVSAVDDIALNDAAREARRTATREAEIRFAHESRALKRQCEEQEERIAELTRCSASSAEKSEQITRLRAEMEAAAAAAMRSKQSQGDAERRAAAAEEEAEQLRGKLRAEQKTSSTLSERWSEEVEKLREDNRKLREDARALRVQATAKEAIAGVAGAWERVGADTPAAGIVTGGNGGGGDREGKETSAAVDVASTPQGKSALILAARAVVNDESGDEAMRLITRCRELEAAGQAAEARERCVLERLTKAEEAAGAQRIKAGAMLLKAKEAMDAAGQELAAAEARAAAAEAAAEAERERNRVAIREQTRKMTHEMKVHQQMLATIHEKRLAAMEAQISEAAAAREREETARAFKAADDRLKTFLNFGYNEGDHVQGTLRMQLEAEVNIAANAMRTVTLPEEKGAGHLEAVHDVFRPIGSAAAVAAVVESPDAAALRP